MKSTKILALLLVVVMCFGVLASCKPKPQPTPTPDTDVYAPKQAEYNTTTSVMPSNWNEFTYADNNDTQILSYISSSLFDYDYSFDGDKYNADGSVNADAIVSGAVSTQYSAATKLEDVTGSVDKKWGYSDEQIEEGGYAWKITLRDDLKWDDGTPITAADFEYSMKAILDPTFMNFRANTYYDTLKVKNSRAYFNSGAPIYTPIVPPYNQDETPDYSFDWKNSEVYLGTESTAMTLASYSINELINDYVGSKEAIKALEIIEDQANEFGYTKITEENLADAMNLLSYALLPFGIDMGSYPESVQEELFMEALFYISGYGDKVEWETVGCYAIPEENAIVICLDKAYSFLNDDGSLSIWAGYYMSSLPLVKQDLYEKCKKAPATGATLWTSNYNSSLDTTASWGPYKLAEFESGSHYRLVKNDQWFGWNMEEYKNQYNITAINCRKVADWSTQWMGFLAGDFDDASLDSSIYADFQDSKYVSYSGSTGTFGMQLFSDLDTLKKSDNNNGILAIKEFRQAFNLAINRSNVIETIWPGTAVPCFGLVNTYYYYDIENAAFLEDGGIYRNNPIAKAGILRAYGYVETDGLWSIGDMTNLTLDEAYSTLTGYNPTLAKEKLKEAINILKADAQKYGYDATKDITIVYGSSSDTDKQRFRADYIQTLLNDLSKGTELEGKIKIVFDASAGSKWADAFRTGATQIGFGYGFSGNAFNPFDIIGAFVNPDDSLNYHMYWDTSEVMMTLKMPEGSYEGAGQEITMSLQNWYFCLNGNAEENDQPQKYNWDAGFAPAEVRLTILSALEEKVIEESYSVMLIGDGGGTFLGAKFQQFSNEYNTFMGFGGLRYMTVVYNDVEWSNFVEQNGGNLKNEYLKSE